MKLIKSIVRPDKVDVVKDALGKLNISGMTVTEVRGHGKQKGHTAIYRGQEYNVSLLPKMEIDVVVPDEVVDEVVKAIIQAARTGEIGDGRVFVLPVSQSYRIRTGELEHSHRARGDVARKKRCTFMIEPDLLDRLRSVKVRTGLSEAEQIRQGIRWWLESREWPAERRTARPRRCRRGDQVRAAQAAPAGAHRAQAEADIDVSIFRNVIQKCRSRRWAPRGGGRFPAGKPRRGRVEPRLAPAVWRVGFATVGALRAERRHARRCSRCRRFPGRLSDDDLCAVCVVCSRDGCGGALVGIRRGACVGSAEPA